MQNSNPTYFNHGSSQYKLITGWAQKTNARKSDDRIEFKFHPETTLILIADGATGDGYGHIASQMLSDYFHSYCEETENPEYLRVFLENSDCHVFENCTGRAKGADTTGIVISLLDGEIVGASIGDSQAVIFGENSSEITHKQKKKPRIGNGMATATSFTSDFNRDETLIIATDGLWNAISTETVQDILNQTNDIERILEILFEKAKSEFGRYDDDISIVCVQKLR